MQIFEDSNVFVVFYKSITDIKYYKNFIYGKTGRAVRYLIFISAVFFLIGMIPNLISYRNTTNTLFENIDELPYFEISNGKFHMESDQYHVVMDDKKAKLIVVLDPVGEYRKSDMDYYEIAILLTETQLMQKTGSASHIIDLNNLSMFKFTKDSIMKGFGSLFIWMIPALTVYMLIFGIGVKFIACYFIYIMCIIYAMIKRIDLDRKSIFRVSCYSITLPVLIGSLLSLTNVSVIYWDWIFILSGFLYGYNAIKRYAKDNNKYINLEDSNSL